MCGRFSQQRPASELAEIFAAQPLADELGPSWNVAPTDEALVVVQREERRAVVAYRWGLIPHWAENARVASRMFNARSETLATSPAFADAVRRKRCLIPVDAFYEWQRIGSRRQPFTIGRSDGRPLALAGLWSGWRDPERDAVIRTFTIVTTGPNEQMLGLHDRMPVVMPDDAWARWLDPDVTDVGELQGLFEPSDEVALRIQPVRDLVNNVRNNGPELVEPIDLADVRDVARRAAAARPVGLFD
ncbi:MAG TPA: SOS response-associated peptidase [Candidatus Limnocylindrales bacterium]|nr:SOS response-associated peptidase [Candidatus Limnocylindrales bacterium]